MNTYTNTHQDEKILLNINRNINGIQSLKQLLKFNIEN